MVESTNFITTTTSTTTIKHEHVEDDTNHSDSPSSSSTPNGSATTPPTTTLTLFSSTTTKQQEMEELNNTKELLSKHTAMTNNMILTKSCQPTLVVSLRNFMCTIWASICFFSLWIPAYFCSVLSFKICRWFGLDSNRAFTSQFMRVSSRLAVKLNPFWNIKYLELENAPKKNTNDGRLIFICNHQSNMDPIAINSVFDWNAKWVAKDSIFNVPFGGYMMHHCGDIPLTFATEQIEDTNTLKQSAKNCLQVCKEWLEQNCPVFIFPEGRRSITQNVLEFKKGAFILAKQTKSFIVPMAIHGTGDIWPVHQSLASPGKAVVVMGSPIDPSKYNDLDDLVRDAREHVIQLHDRAKEEWRKIRIKQQAAAVN
ncbi:hypothetical protein C9374_005752 [Naegleria lovaniensis]|uniref:Phospholipid/glycerol acyltransferase domain-containing protein n=1 Tax=Naegleria lovaniensis TaxID=51637 RepID=A0AA88GQ06_NAELO|nr:uncharacterized protein C9374_005752 [Naegleria lovaniensis]KAG2381960.1 hypothetical protein C9374_005752 [Naegleria lovaniensis]